MTPIDQTVYSRAARVLVLLFLFEAAVLLILVGIYKLPVYDKTILFTRAGILLIIGIAILAVTGWLLVRQIVASELCRGRIIVLGLSANLLSGLVALLLLEGTVRLVSRVVNEEIVVGSVLVRPTWPELRERSRKAFGGVSALEDRDTSYFVYDASLGWTVGINRQSRHGLYFSSLEGVRSGAPNVRMLDREEGFRVALVGDSHAFSLEVPFEESWGFYLQKQLGKDVQVANFGVNGYGIDQMYLRYQRDVRPWNPHLVAIAFTGHDLLRTMAVYPFVSFGWPGYLVKPRFAMENGSPRLINAPLPTPREIFSARQIRSLPFIEYDLAYGSAEWYWRFDHGPLFLRFLTSAIPRWSVADPRVSEEATIELNGALLRQFVESIEEAGAVPMLVNMSKHDDPLSRTTLARARLTVIDGATCWADVPPNQRWVPSGFHQSGPANEAVAGCTGPAIKSALWQNVDTAVDRASEPAR